MAEGSGGEAPPGVPTPPPPTLKGLREQMVAAAQALADERRNQGGASTVSLQAPISTKAKPVLDGSLLKSEERQRLARERREEREKQHAAKETQILEKEKKAKLQYEKQMEEKQKRLKEQKLKEQQRRAAVEQKRRQKMEEEKVHYEAVVHRTLERSQRLDTRQKRWSWSGSVTDSSGKAEAPAVAEANKRSTSALNLKQPNPALHKRLSSSAALLSSPSMGTAKRSSSLNRLNNKSSLSSEQGLADALQAEQKGEPEKKRSSSLSRVSSKLPEVENVQKEEKASTSFPALLPKVPLRSRSTDRLKGAACSSEKVSSESAPKTEPAKQPPSSSVRRAPSPSLPSSRRSVSPGKAGKLPPSPATIRRRPPPSSPNVSRQRQSSPMTACKPAPIQRPPLTPNVLGVTKKKSDTESKANDAAPQEQGAAGPPSEKESPAGPPKTKEDASGKTLPGTTTAEEASKILAEKRRLAREQREREDQEKLQREEEERIRQEELARIAQEKQAQEEAALQETGEQKRAEEEEQRLAEKDRIQREQEEQEKQAELQLQREEAEARASEEAERQRQERERIMQQNLQERLERKKRIEEIMKRTRKAELSEAKNEDKSNEEDEDVEEDEEQGLEKQDQPASDARPLTRVFGGHVIPFCDLLTSKVRGGSQIHFTTAVIHLTRKVVKWGETRLTSVSLGGSFGLNCGRKPGTACSWGPCPLGVPSPQLFHSPLQRSQRARTPLWKTAQRRPCTVGLCRKEARKWEPTTSSSMGISRRKRKGGGGMGTPCISASRWKPVFQPKGRSLRTQKSCTLTKPIAPSDFSQTSTENLPPGGILKKSLISGCILRRPDLVRRASLLICPARILEVAPHYQQAQSWRLRRTVG
ncbi:MAP7 domain-containing protein 3 isoform 2-T2 [Vipera latastei]